MFFENLTRELEKRHLTVNKLVKAIGFSQSATTKWRKGTLPNGDIIIRICKYLNVSADYLLDLEVDSPPPLTDRELRLLAYYQRADDRGKESIEELAQREAERNSPKETTTLLNSVG